MKNKVLKFLGLPFSRKLEYIEYLMYKFKTQIMYKYIFKAIGKNSVIKSNIFITPEFISVGKNITIGHDARIEGINAFAGNIYYPNIILEDGVSFQQRCHITAADTLIIGKNTIASFDVMITDIDHEYKEIGIPIGEQQLRVNKTYIGEKCFLGAGVKIQAGTILGKQCIVGSNSVVRGIFPDYCVIVGTPARIIKRYNEKNMKWERTDSKGAFIS